MFWKLVTRFSKGVWTDPKAVTPERVRHFFEWSAASGFIGTGIPRGSGLSYSLRIEPEPKDVTYTKDIGPMKAGQVRHVPAHLHWGSVPVFGEVSLENGKVVFRYTCKSELLPEMPRANPVQAARVAAVFEEYYAHLGLPESIIRLREEAAAKAARQRPGEGKLVTIRRYLSGEIDLDDLSSAGNVLMWVDWRESDDKIVEMCEALIATGQLSAEFRMHSTRKGLDITYGAKRVYVDYPDPQSDRDTTLIALALAISGSHGLRFAVDSDGSDTLAFLPLKTSEWAALERELPEAVAAKFRAVAEGARFFQ